MIRKESLRRMDGRAVAILLVVVGALLLGWGCTAYSSGEIVVQVLSPPKDAEPGDFVSHVFSVTNLGEVRESILITTEIPAGWRLLGVPPVLRIDAGEEEVIFLTVIIPPVALAGEYTITLTAKLERDPAVRDSAVAMVTVLPVVGVQVIPPEGAYVDPGERVYYEFIVVNTGNAPDAFQIEATSGHHWDVNLPVTLISLAPGERGSIKVVLTVPPDALPSRDPLRFSARSIITVMVLAETFLFTTILPPPPHLIGGTLFEDVLATLRLSLGQDMIIGDIRSDLLFSLRGIVKEGLFTFAMRGAPLFGPDPFQLAAITARYQYGVTDFAVGDVSQRFTRLLSLSGRGGSVRINKEMFRLGFLAAQAADELRSGGVINIGPAILNFGLAYMEQTGNKEQRRSWSITGRLFPLPEWELSVEGALGKVDELPSRALWFNTTIDTGNYDLIADLFSVGSHFPGAMRDREGVRITQWIRFGDFALRSNFNHVRDNVDRNPLVATSVSDQVRLNVSLIPWEDAPRVIAGVEFDRDRTTEPLPADEHRRVFFLTISHPVDPLPYSLGMRISDQRDLIADTHFRTFSFTQGVGFSIDEHDFFLSLSQRRRLDLLTNEIISREVDTHLRFRPRGVLHSAIFSLFINEGEFSLAGSATIRLTPRQSIILSARWAWDEDDRDVDFSILVTADISFDLPIPFFLTRGRIEGRVFIDRNGNFVFDEGDEGVPGAVVWSERSEVSTGETGFFRFLPFQPGIHPVNVRLLPHGTTPAIPLPVQVALQAGETVWVDIPLRPILSVSGYLFNDLDQDGLHDPGEGGFATVRALLTDRDRELIAVTHTAALGRFDFWDVLPGQYIVSIDPATLPERFVFTTPETAAVEVVIDIAVTEVIFGGYIAPPVIIIPLIPPTADFVFTPQVPRVGEVVQFDGGYSFDLDGWIISFEWDFDDDGVIDIVGEIVEHTFTAVGQFPVTLIVTDNDGLSNSITLIVVVQ
ncbi:PKD domain-containing protein [Candidatus Acetothermia bacterium]|jgi:hypothetical protein|nr:PKD domain-containing protein [Candidatus Acetothermia bacterium]